MRGIAWTGGSKWAVQLVSWAGLVALARLLRPEDFGLLGLANLYLGLVGMLTEFGLGTSILTLPNLDRTTIAQLNSVAVGMGLLGTAATCLAAYPLAWYFRSPDLQPVVLVLSLTFLLASLRTVPSALLQRELRFKALGLLEAGQALATTILSVGLAWLGYRYWALAWSALIGTALGTLALQWLRPHPFARPRRGIVARSLTFSGQVVTSRLAWYVYSNADFAVAGRVLGTHALGLYKQAWDVASVPVEKVSALVTRVTPAFFANLQADAAALKRMVLRLTEGLLFLTLPATLGLSVVADQFVLIAFGPQWVAAAVPLRLLGLFASFRSIVTLLPQVLTVRGETRMLMRNGIVTAIGMPLAFLLGTRWGAPGIAAMWLLAYPLSTILLYRRTFASLGLTLREYLSVVWPTIRGSGLMVVAVVLTRVFLPLGWPLALRFTIEILAGAIVYLITTVLPERERVLRLVALVRHPESAEIKPDADLANA